MKQTSKAAFTPAAMTAEEIAVIVPIADAVIEDDEMELWTVLRPALVQAFARRVDAAVLFGIDKPASWGASLSQVNIHVLAAGVLESRRVGEVGGWVVRDGGWYQVGAGVGGRQGSPVRALRMPARTSTPCLRMVSM